MTVGTEHKMEQVDEFVQTLSLAYRNWPHERNLVGKTTWLSLITAPISDELVGNVGRNPLERRSSIQQHRSGWDRKGAACRIIGAGLPPPPQEITQQIKIHMWNEEGSDCLNTAA